MACLFYFCILYLKRRKSLTLASLLAQEQRRQKPRRHVEVINTRPLAKGCVCRASSAPDHRATWGPRLDSTPRCSWGKDLGDGQKELRVHLQFFRSICGYHLKWNLPLRQGMACVGHAGPTYSHFPVLVNLFSHLCLCREPVVRALN